jgi:hypothetical protein
VAGSVVDLPDAVGHPVFPRTLEALVARSGGTTLDAARDALSRPEILEEFVVPRPRVLVPLVPTALFELGAPDGGSGPDDGRRSVLGPGGLLHWPKGAARIACDVRVACVVGRSGRGPKVGSDGRRIFGYTVLADWRIVGRSGGAQSRPAPEAASGRFAASLGPWLVTADELPGGEVPVTALIDGEVRAQGRLSVSEPRFAELVARAPGAGELGPGEVFGSGAFEPACQVELSRRRHRSATVSIRAGVFGVLKTRLAPR